MADKKSLQFDEFEHFFPEGELHHMHQLLENGAVQRAVQNQLNAWNYLIRYDTDQFECEVRYNLRSVKQGLCACGFKGTSRFCKHVLLATFWHVLKVYRRKHSVSRNTLKSLEFHHFVKDDLINFLQAMLRFNPKSRYWLDFVMDAEKVKSLDFESCHRLTQSYLDHFNAEHKTAISQEKQLLLITQELYYLGMKAYSEADPMKASLLVYTALKTLFSQWKDKGNINKDRLIQAAIRYEDALQQLLHGIIAPQTLNAFIHEIFAFLESDVYHPCHPKLNLYQLLLNKFRSKEIERKVVHQLKEKCLLANSTVDGLLIWHLLYETDHQAFLRFLKSSEFSKKQSYATIVSYIGLYGKDMSSSLLWSLCNNFYHKWNISLKKQAVQYLMMLQPSSSEVKEVSILLHMYLDFNSRELLEFYFSTPVDVHALKDIALQIFKDPSSMRKDNHDPYLDLYLVTSDWKNLINALLKSNNIDCIMQYDVFIPEKERQMVVDKYKEYLDQFKKSNVGPKAKERLKEIGKHIMNYYAKSLPTMMGTESLRL